NDFQPQWRACAAADSSDASDIRAGSFQGFKTVAESEGDAIEHRMGQDIRIALMAKPHHQPADLRIGDGGTLARKIGQEQCRRWPSECLAERCRQFGRWRLEQAR